MSGMFQSAAKFAVADCISDTPKSDIIWTENSDVIDSFISETSKYESSNCVLDRKTLGRTALTIYTIISQYSSLLFGLINGVCWYG